MWVRHQNLFLFAGCLWSPVLRPWWPTQQACQTSWLTSTVRHFSQHFLVKCIVACISYPTYIRNTGILIRINNKAFMVWLYWGYKSKYVVKNLSNDKSQRSCISNIPDKKIFTVKECKESGRRTTLPKSDKLDIVSKANLMTIRLIHI